MRPPLWLSLLSLALIATGAQAQNGPGRPQKLVVTPVKRAGEPYFSEQGVGTWKKTPEEAKEDARDKGMPQVEAFLRRVDSSLEWLPAMDRHVMVREEEIEEKDFDDVGKMYKAHVRLEVSPQARDEILRVGRQHVVEVRQAWLFKLLAGAVAVLLLGAGYVRLEQSNKGPAVRRLRLGAAALVLAVVVAGLWLFA